MEFMLLHEKWNEYIYIFISLKLSLNSVGREVLHTAVNKGDSVTMWALKELQFPCAKFHRDKSYLKTALV